MHNIRFGTGGTSLECKALQPGFLFMHLASASGEEYVTQHARDGPQLCWCFVYWLNGKPYYVIISAGIRSIFANIRIRNIKLIRDYR